MRKLIHTIPMTYYTLGSNRVEIHTMVYVFGKHIWTFKKSYYEKEEPQAEPYFPIEDEQSEYLGII